MRAYNGQASDGINVAREWINITETQSCPQMYQWGNCTGIRVNRDDYFVTFAEAKRVIRQIERQGSRCCAKGVWQSLKAGELALKPRSHPIGTRNGQLAITHKASDAFAGFRRNVRPSVVLIENESRHAILLTGKRMALNSKRAILRIFGHDARQSVCYRLARFVKEITQAGSSTLPSTKLKLKIRFDNKIHGVKAVPMCKAVILRHASDI